jgi:Resolvase, N terminal domain
VVVAYVYTHLKFAFRLTDYHFWDVIHLTTFRQKFYDQYLNRRVKYARHAISIDERQSAFPGACGKTRSMMASAK